VVIAGDADDRDDRIAALAARMAAGDRAAAGEFVGEYGPRIRRRVRSKLSRGLRVFFDSFDLLGTVARRLDRAVSGREFRGATPGQVWSYVNSIADRAIIDRSRWLDRVCGDDEGDRDLAALLEQRVARVERGGEGDSDLLREAVAAIADPIDREILWYWVSGTPQSAMADLLGLSVPAVKNRWLRLRGLLAERLTGLGAVSGREEA
jgi:RNA polymerase sigma factor (sigma-70 family)